MNQRLRAAWPRTLVWGLVWVGFVVGGLSQVGIVILLVASSFVLLFAVRAFAWLVENLRRRLGKPARSNGVDSQRGVAGLLVVLALGSVMPMALRTWFFPSESKVQANLAISLFAGILDLKEQVLLAKEAKPEIVANLRAGSGEAREQALLQIEPINLKGRSLRGADFRKALLSRADLRESQLQGADLTVAQLQGADLTGAQLQGADLSRAELQGANLSRAELQGADLRDAQLQGADLSGAELQGANLSRAQLQSAELRAAALYGVTIEGADVDYVRGTTLLDIREMSREILPQFKITRLEKMVANAITIDERRREMVLERLRRAGKPGETPPKWESCLRDERTAQEITCKQQWSSAEIATFRAALHPVLVSLACESTAAAKGFIRQVDRALDIEDRSRWGLAQKLAARINDPACLGVYTMTPADKDKLVILAKRDAVAATTPQSLGRRR